ncbi:MAG: GPI inositol-deacylase [Desulfobacterales bacterium]|jgi:pimeloyl-ACP methyl ester carboxylesterase|nr:GPI inositol-deacylase [Desulfobacterales bacterium]
MKKVLFILICLFLGATVSAYAGTYDLVLVHGLTNKHQWSDSFLDKCLVKYGSGNVYAIYTNESTRVWERWINGRKLICCGENDFSAGDDSVATQASLMRTKTSKLQTSYGLSTKFKIIAHSMGGLVSRRYIYNNPGTVAGLVTLGTPHQGSPLAYEGSWVSFFIGAGPAVDNLKPSWVQNTFNVSYPAPGPMATGGKIYTIGGDGDGWDCWGWAGELQVGWDLLFTVHWTDSDGAVGRNAEKISGSTNLTTFWSYDHYELVREPSVADKALAYLSPN